MLKIGAQLMESAEQLERDKGIPRYVFLDSIKEAMLAAYRRQMKLTMEEVEELGFECQLNEKVGEIGIFRPKMIVDTVKEGEEEEKITLQDALEIDAGAEKGEYISVDITPEDFGRIAAQTAKQVMMQRIREAEKRMIYNEFEERKHIVTPAIVQRLEGRNIVVSIGRIEAIMPPREQLPGEYYRPGNKIRVYVADLRDNGRVPQIIVSQAHPEMVREVFELEVPEIEDGIVELKNISRDAGFRTKVAVHSTSGDVDAQGACIGARGARIQAIVNELKNEKIDIIRWSEDPVAFITNALAPAKIASVDILQDDANGRVARVVVPEDQLSLAIGRSGQNVRLAARLTGWRLDIKSAAQLAEEMAEAEALAEAYEEDAENAAAAQEAEGTVEEVQAEETTTAEETSSEEEVVSEESADETEVSVEEETVEASEEAVAEEEPAPTEEEASVEEAKADSEDVSNEAETEEASSEEATEEEPAETPEEEKV